MCFGSKKTTYVTKEQVNMKIEKAMKEREYSATFNTSYPSHKLF